MAQSKAPGIAISSGHATDLRGFCDVKPSRPQLGTLQMGGTGSRIVPEAQTLAKLARGTAVRCLPNIGHELWLKAVYIRYVPV